MHVCVRHAADLPDSNTSRRCVKPTHFALKTHLDLKCSVCYLVLPPHAVCVRNTDLVTWNVASGLEVGYLIDYLTLGAELFFFNFSTTCI